MKPRGQGLRLTKVGFWYIVFGLFLALGAANTGNNGLYLVLAVMTAALLFAQILGAVNVGRLDVEITPPGEVFVNQPVHLGVAVRNRRRFLPRWLLVCTLAAEDESRSSSEAEAGPSGIARTKQQRPRSVPFLIERLGMCDTHRGEIEAVARRRGRWRLHAVDVASLFPFGFFHKLVRHPLDTEVLVFPEVFAPSQVGPIRTGRTGETSTRRRGWGNELHALRDFRPGDDPRAIHWKQTARTGRMVVKEREAEESRRLSVVFDNAVGPLTDAGDAVRFERLVSEAATAALDALARGFDVELVTRDEQLPFGAGWRQRLRILETLALVGPRPEATTALVERAQASRYLLLAMEPVSRTPAREAVA